ncbi:MAG: cation:proton antiporter [Gemmatimonadaceae bacterium]
MAELLALVTGPVESHGIGGLLIALVALLLSTKLLGELAQRMGQPAVLGELLAGVVLGGSVLGVVDPSDPVIFALAELGVIILLFEIGLHTDIGALVRVGRTASTVGLVGVAIPFGAGYLVVSALGLGMIPALVCGAALTATSVGISARVLSDLGQLERPEGQVVLGAAVLDDIVGLIILSVVANAVGGDSVTVLGVAKTTAIAVGFVAVAILAGRRVAPPLFRAVERIQTAGALGVIALAFAFGLAWLADWAGSAMIIGAFAAGLVLHPTPQRQEIERATTAIGFFFVPIFFASVGAAVELDALADGRALLVGGSLIVVGIAGKVAAGFAPFWFRGNKLLIGTAMVPRGEVGLIFAQLGLATGAIDAGLFGALMIMVLVTTFVAPPALSRIVAAAARRPQDQADQPGDGGIDDLVAGTSLSDEELAAVRRAREAER